MQQVDFGGNGSENVSFQIDAQGKSRILYDTYGGVMHYATEATGGFTVTDVANTNGYNVVHHALALDGSGNPHIAFHQRAPSGSLPQLVYVSVDGGTFVREDTGYYYMGANADYGSELAISVSATGVPDLVAISSFSDLDIKTKSSTGWTMETLDPATSGGVGKGAVDAFRDSSGTLHASWIIPNGIGYARRPAGGTATLEKLATGVVAYGLALGVSPSGTPHIVYYDSGAMMHAVRSSTGTWTETALVGIPASTEFSLVVDSANALHFAMAQNGTHALYYVKVSGASVSFSRLGPITYNRPIIRLDGSGNPRIAFIGSDSHVRLAR